MLDIVIPETWTHEHAVIHLLKEIRTHQKLEEEKMSVELDNLNKNIADLKAKFEAFLATVDPAAGVQAAADAVAAISAEIPAPPAA